MTKAKLAVTFGAVALVGVAGAWWAFSGDDIGDDPTNKTVIGEKTTAWSMWKDHKVTVTRYDDPKIEGITIFVSRAERGGFLGTVGLASDPSNASIAVRQTGPIRVKEGLDQQENVLSESASPLFKEVHITRMHDEKTDGFVYLVTSDKIIDGSAKNSISVVIPQDWEGVAPDLDMMDGIDNRTFSEMYPRRPDGTTYKNIKLGL